MEHHHLFQQQQINLNLDPHLIKLTYHQHIDQSLLNQQHHKPLTSQQHQHNNQQQQQTISEELLTKEQPETNDFNTETIKLEPQEEDHQSILQPLEIILPTNRFLFPESEQSFTFHPTQLQHIHRIRQENQTSTIQPRSHHVVSIGKIPSAPGTQTGKPFDDGFTFLIPPSPPSKNSNLHDQSIQSVGLPQLDPNLLQSSSNLPRRRVGRPRKNPINYNDSRCSTQSKQINDLEKKVQDKKPVMEFSSQRVDDKLRNPRLSDGSGHPTRVISGSKPADPEASTTRAIPERTGPSPMSRKKEPWMSELKSIYASNLSKRSPADLLVPYPKVGDTYKTVEGFKGACLLASWPAGHDMHVRNHYKADLWERCVFTCRHDRSPPKGLSCPFKIVAMGYKTNGNRSQPVEEWKVIKSHLVHRNHPVGPGMFDPLGKRSYRKRAAGDDLNETTTNTSLQPPKKRGRPPLPPVRTQIPPRPKPPPSVSFPAPTAQTEWSRLSLSPSSSDSASSASDVYSPNASSNSSALENIEPSRLRVK
ncbi:hypothetical protein PGT21_001283 [Puccinia graminis f. sp. tritici]|uniref:Uncharacterized protein n=1 Tax=Puccinia graminis f. sp. tritici TaxID=56615 RepID=A0A5B0PSN7_PUCGR|nr:hypothetical protein PGT21_001283 [Puccinia graminis f. sp. tritici]